MCTLGRYNQLFAGSDGGADRWAINDVEPYAYRRTFSNAWRAVTPWPDSDELLAWNWNAAAASD